jgi:hypothetical protein
MTSRIACGMARVLLTIALIAGGTHGCKPQVADRDGVPPDIAIALKPPPNDAGWNNTPVVASFSCKDAASGIASCPGPVALDAEGAAQAVRGTAVDLAGNTGSASATVNIDLTPPTLAITSSPGGTQVTNPSLSMSGTVGDLLSGVAAVTCGGTPATVSAGGFTCSIGLTPGPNSIFVQAVDVAGNSSTATVAVTLVPAQPTPADEVAALEAGGQLPHLDRSSSVSGQDADLNGIRDDIDTYLSSLSLAAPQRESADQLARAQQASLTVDSSDAVKVGQAGQDLVRAVGCLRSRFAGDEDFSWMATRIEAITANTRERAHQYIAFNRALSQMSFVAPDGVDPCDGSSAPVAKPSRTPNVGIGTTATPPAPCKGGITIGFFNGVHNSLLQAEMAKTYMKQNLGIAATYSDEPVEFEVFYNQTGADPNRPDATWLEDIAETFEQRSQELDGALLNRFEILWETLGSSSDQSALGGRMTTSIAARDVALSGLVATIYDDVVTGLAAQAAYLVSHPPTQQDYATQQQRVQEVSADKLLLVLVAHSQGNFFMNLAYDAAQSIANPAVVKAIHVAPASPQLRGGPANYVLADLDQVINVALRLIVLEVPPSNVALPVSHLLTDDITGHLFITTYLNGGLATYPRVQALVLNAIQTGLQQSSVNGSCISITKATCVLAGDLFRIDITGTASTAINGAFVSGSSNPSLGFDPGAQVSSCDQWTGFASDRGLIECAKRAGDPARTTWHTANAWNPADGAVISADAGLFIDDFQIVRSVVPLSCPGAFP